MNLTKICQPLPHIFTLDEANELVPLLQKISARYHDLIEKELDKQRFFIKTGASDTRINTCDAEVSKAMVAWGSKITKLGGKVLVGGYIGLDCGFGYYSWRFGETRIEWYHDYLDSPISKRRMLVYPEKVDTLVID